MSILDDLHDLWRELEHPCGDGGLVSRLLDEPADLLSLFGDDRSDGGEILSRVRGDAFRDGPELHGCGRKPLQHAIMQITAETLALASASGPGHLFAKEELLNFDAEASGDDLCQGEVFSAPAGAVDEKHPACASLPGKGRRGGGLNAEGFLQVRIDNAFL